jgi:cell division protein FtsW
MTTFSRTDNSVMGRWWWTVDRWSLAAVVALMAFGTMLALASSPAVAERIGVDSLYFVKRHLVFLPLAAGVIVATSLMTPMQIRRLALIAFAGCLLGLGATLLFGIEINGARRWLSLGGISVQVTEFAKPTFAVVTAWLLAEKLRDRSFPGHALTVISFAALIALTISQPDLGQTAVIGAVWMSQLFLAGLPMALVVGLILLGLAGLAGSYMTLTHVASRINRFIDPATGDTYQIDRSLMAFSNGGFFGQGPGEGTVKNSLPEAHADFVFAVAGEELGLLLTLVIVILFAFIVLRGLVRTMVENNLFVLLAVSGLLVQFGLQTLINMASSLQLIPTKGMTLPFISYGGSSLLAIAMGIGMVLALTRRRRGKAEAA